MTSVNLRSLMESNKLTGPNFLDWLRNLRIVLKSEKIGYVLDEALPNSPTANASKDVQKAYLKHFDDSEMVSCIMLPTMSAELQKQHTAMDANSIVYHLRELFDEQARSKRFKTLRLLFCTKMVEGVTSSDLGLDCA